MHNTVTCMKAIVSYIGESSAHTYNVMCDKLDRLTVWMYELSPGGCRKSSSSGQLVSHGGDWWLQGILYVIRGRSRQLPTTASTTSSYNDMQLKKECCL